MWLVARWAAELPDRDDDWRAARQGERRGSVEEEEGIGIREGDLEEVEAEVEAVRGGGGEEEVEGSDVVGG